MTHTGGDVAAHVAMAWREHIAAFLHVIVRRGPRKCAIGIRFLLLVLCLYTTPLVDLTKLSFSKPEFDW
jgi:hypothetical protein